MIEVYAPGQYILLNDKKMYISSVLIEDCQKVSYKLGCWVGEEFKTSWIDSGALEILETPKSQIGFKKPEK